MSSTPHEMLDDHGPLTAALWYAAEGWAVLPIHWVEQVNGSAQCSCGKQDCGSVGKHPLLHHGSKDATKDETAIRAWWEKWPKANVGIATGSVSGIWVLDVDSKSGGHESLRELEATHGRLPYSPLVITGSDGQHYYFRFDPGNPVKNRQGLVPGIDVRGEGGYVLAPPSIHKCGKNYKWEIDNRPTAVRPVPPPAWLLDAVLGRRAPEVPGLPTEGGSAPPRKKCAPSKLPCVDHRLERARSYLARIPGALSGQGGHDQTWAAALSVVVGFDLPEEIGFQLLLSDYNPKCEPPWSEGELRHKVNDAATRATLPRGYLLNDEGGSSKRVRRKKLNPRPKEMPLTGQSNEGATDPHRLARIFIERAEEKVAASLRYWHQEFWAWRSPLWSKVEMRTIEASICRVIKEEFDRINRVQMDAFMKEGGEGDPPETLRVTRGLQSDVLNAVQSNVHVSDKVQQPSWLDGDGPVPANEVIAAPNGLFRLSDLVANPVPFLPPTPRFFSPCALNFEIESKPCEPKLWFDFLRSIFPDDAASQEHLQEVFGYLLSSETNQQKIFLLIGPPRSGKGTIARVLQSLLNPNSTIAPTLASLGSHFGLWQFIGKTAAIIGDARLGSRTDKATALERLLSISGEDAVSIDRKYLSIVTMTLPVRFLIISNEMPAFFDPSGALAARLMVTRLKKSWVGKEDTRLTESLLAEKTGILQWAAQGWKRLRDRGRFVQSESGRQLVEVFEELSSPVTAFVKDHCTVADEAEVRCSELYALWQKWCAHKGIEHPSDEQTFGRDLHAAVPTVVVTQRRVEGNRPRFYRGIRINA